MGLGKVNENAALFLTLAGGYIWDRKAEKNHPQYAEQEYTKADGEVAARTGARYGDLTGMVVDVKFRTHKEFGENLNVTVESDGEKYTISVGLESRYCSDLMKGLLSCDLEKPIFIKPYDFKDKGQRKVGISFRQDGSKVVLAPNPKDPQGQPTKSKEWFQDASKREIKRFFEDVIDYLSTRVKDEVCVNYKDAVSSKKDKSPSESTQKEEKSTSSEKSEKSTVSAIKMKKAIKAYVKENYGEDQEIPASALKGEELKKWYQLVLEEEELPFPEPTSDEVDPNEDDDLKNQLDALIEDED